MLRSGTGRFTDLVVSTQDVWFLVSKKPQLLLLDSVLQRWLDFLTVYGLQDKGEMMFSSYQSQYVVI